MNEVAYSLKLPNDTLSALMKAVLKGKPCSICMDSVEDKGSGVFERILCNKSHISIEDQDVNVSIKTNPFVTEVTSIGGHSLQYVVAV